jgi:hypothetical protein
VLAAKLVIKSGLWRSGREVESPLLVRWSIALFFCSLALFALFAVATGDRLAIRAALVMALGIAGYAPLYQVLDLRLLAYLQPVLGIMIGIGASTLADKREPRGQALASG